jgi:hypothetical protein
VVENELDSLRFPGNPAVDDEVIQIGFHDVDALAVWHRNALLPSAAPEFLGARDQFRREPPFFDES